MLPRKHTAADRMQLVLSCPCLQPRNAAHQAFLLPSFEYRNPMTIDLFCGLIESALGYFNRLMDMVQWLVIPKGGSIHYMYKGICMICPSMQQTSTRTPTGAGKLLFKLRHSIDTSFTQREFHLVHILGTCRFHDVFPASCTFSTVRTSNDCNPNHIAFR